MKKEEVKFESTGKATELVHRTEITGTPFSAVKLNGTNKSFLAIGMYKLTDDIFNDIDDILDYIKNNQWDLIMSIALIAIKITNEKNS